MQIITGMRKTGVKCNIRHSIQMALEPKFAMGMFASLCLSSIY